MVLHKTISWASAVIASVLLLQTLYFKFSAAPESGYIFTKLDLEPIGRIATGVAELIASILLLLPKSRVAGALFGVLLMIGALVSHLTKPGIEVQNDGGYLFVLCLIVLFCGFICLYLERKYLSALLKREPASS